MVEVVTEAAKKTVEVIKKVGEAYAEVSRQKELISASLNKALGMGQGLEKSLRAAEKLAIVKSAFDEYT